MGNEPTEFENPIDEDIFDIPTSTGRPGSNLNDFDINEIVNPNIPDNVCLLPPELDYSGTVKLLEDCPTLGQYPAPPVPIPAPTSQKLGVHPSVCCPKYRSPNVWCTPDDPWCPTYEPPDYSDYKDNSDYDEYAGDYD